MVQEIWLRVVEYGFEDLYEVSDLGQVRRIDTGWILAPGRHPKGYQTVVLSGHGRRKSVLVHTLVLEAFTGPRPEGKECRHRDGDPWNNAHSNLRWGTHSENELDKAEHGTAMQGEHNVGAVLTEAQAREICRRHAAGESQRALSREFPVSQPQISRIVNGKKWAHLV